MGTRIDAVLDELSDKECGELPSHE